MNKTSTVSPARAEILNSTLIRPNTLKYCRVKLSTSVMYHAVSPVENGYGEHGETAEDGTAHGGYETKRQDRKQP